jgi:[ribosomal protein S5]-alanine N-acetyltransferase
MIRRVRFEDGGELIAANLASIALHEPWVYPCRDHASFLAYLTRSDGDKAAGYIARDRGSGRIVGVVNLNEIVRGTFQNAYLGYYGMSGMERRGLMSEAVSLVVSHAFAELGLHRIEANIQPDNTPSLALARRLGFRREGYSPRYLKIGGEWRDQERWAIFAEEWRGRWLTGRSASSRPRSARAPPHRHPRP